MSYKKIRVIQPETVRVPEKGYIYLGYGYSSTYNATAPWIKKDDASIILISGGTGGGGGTLYWQLDGSLLRPTSTSYRVQIGATSSSETLTVGGGVKVGMSNNTNPGTIRYDSSDPPDFEGYVSGKGWVSLTASGSSAGTSGDSYWSPVSEGIQYPDGKVYIGSSFSPSRNDDILTIDGGITLGETSETNAGTLRYLENPTANQPLDLQGYVRGAWRSLTGTKPIQQISTNTNLDESYHTVICTNSSQITVRMPPIEDALNSEFIICRYGVGNIIVGTTEQETIYTEYIYFFNTSGTAIDFDSALPAGADSDNLLYSVTLRPLVSYPGVGDATWLVTQFSTAYVQKA